MATRGWDTGLSDRIRGCRYRIQFRRFPDSPVLYQRHVWYRHDWMPALRPDKPLVEDWIRSLPTLPATAAPCDDLDAEIAADRGEGTPDDNPRRVQT